MLCAGAAEQSMSQWASLFAENGLGVPKAVGDIASPCFGRQRRMRGGVCNCRRHSRFASFRKDGAFDWCDFPGCVCVHIEVLHTEPAVALKFI